MKMIATTGAAPRGSYAAYVHNCLRNAACEPPWAAPLPGVPYLQLYVDFGAYKPVTYELWLQDMCNLAHAEQLLASNYIVGQTPDGTWYGVFKYFTHPLLPVTNFVVWLSVQVDAPGGLVERTYFSELLQAEVCLPLTKVKACYPETATNTGFDLLGRYYGLPVNGDFLGFDGIRYFHIAYARLAKARELPPKATFTSNLIRTFRSSVDRTWSLETELVPKWYYEELLAIYARGALSLDDGETYLVSDVNADGINDDDLTWKPFATLKQTTRLFFGCDTSVCVECCSPRVLSATSTFCCSPTVLDATVEVVEESASASASVSDSGGCAPVQFLEDGIPDAVVDEPYSYDLHLLGDPPFLLGSEAHPGWMTVTLDGSVIHLTGTPPFDFPDAHLVLEVFNCSNDFSDTLDVFFDQVLAGSSSAGSFDEDALAFIDEVNTVGSLTPTEEDAINQLVVDLKDAGLWDDSKMLALWPMVGGTAATHVYNLKHPASAFFFRLILHGTWTHDANGMTGDGATAYADTQFNTSAEMSPDDGCMGYYSRTNSNLAEVEMGSQINAVSDIIIACRFSDNNFYPDFGSATFPNVPNADSRGLFCVNRLSLTNTQGFKNGAEVLNAAETVTLQNQNIFIGAINNSGTPIDFSVKQCALAFISRGLTDPEHATLYTIIQAFQTALGRQV